MNSELNQYISFMNETLGVKTILVNRAENTSNIENENLKYFIFVQSLSSYSHDESSLLEKMISALKLDPVEFGVFDQTESALMNDKKKTLKIILCDQPQEKGETYSPRTLLMRPELKRKAWDDLKLTFSIK